MPSLAKKPAHPATRQAQKLNEHYREIVRRLREPRHGVVRGPLAVGVTSCTPGEGVSTVAMNLAVCAAESYGEPVLLIDANLARPSLERHFKAWQIPGLTDVLFEQADTAKCVQESPVPNLWLMAGGSPKTQAGRAADADSLSEMIQTLKRDFSLIFVDLPAADQPAACLTIAGQLDGVLLVVEAERVRSHVALRTKRLLEESHANLFGVVFNKRQNHLPGWLYRTL